ncbi:MAG: NTP transferase domain-containing protein [Desulfobacteraceae bacterium]|nr:NTP transferase domain-containing protein [Desulfobacteraceae bacterium]
MFNSNLKLSDFTFLILAGGFGTRLNPILNGYPKVLANINGRPFIFYLLELIKNIGGKNVIICTGYKADEVKQCIIKQYGECLNISFSRETTPLGTAGALRLGLDYIKSEFIIVLNGDSYIKTDLSKFIDWCISKQCKAALLLTEVMDTTRYGKVTLGKNGIITQFVEKGSCAGKGMINAGVYFLQKSMLLKIPPQKKISLEKEFFPKLVGLTLYGYISSGKFIDIGTPESYEKAREFF